MVSEFDEDEPDYFCEMCKRKIDNPDEMVTVTEFDEEAGVELEETEEIYCTTCMPN